MKYLAVVSGFDNDGEWGNWWQVVFEADTKEQVERTRSKCEEAIEELSSRFNTEGCTFDIDIEPLVEVSLSELAGSLSAKISSCLEEPEDDDE